MGPLVHRRALLAALAVASLLPTASASAAEPVWLAPRAVPASGPSAGAPRIAVNRGGDAALVWVRGGADPGVLASVRPSGSVDWPTPERLSAACPSAARSRCSFADPRVAIDDDGDVAAVWVSDAPASAGGASVQAAVNLAGSGAWTRPQSLSLVVGARLAADVGIDGRGTVTAVWRDGDLAIRAATRPAGAGWSQPARLSGSQRATAPELAVGPRGDAVAVWGGDDCRPWAARRPAGRDWDPPLALEPAGACGDGPGAGVDADGDALAAWRHWTGTGRTLRASELRASADEWQTSVDVGPAAAGALDPPPLAVGSDGRAILVWKDDAGAVRFATRPPGRDWGPPQPVPGAAGTAPSIDFALGPDGSSMIALGGGGGRSPRAIGRPADAGWGNMMPIGPAPARGFLLPAVDVDASGGAIAAWSEQGAIMVGELTSRPGTRLVIPPPGVRRLEGPVASPAGALAHLRASLDAPAQDLPFSVQRRVRGAWVRLATVRVTAVAVADLPVRLLQPGAQRLRVLTPRAGGGARASDDVIVRVTRPGRRRLAVGAAPAGVAAGEGGVWVLGSEGGEGTVRRLDPGTGRSAGRLILVGGAPTAIAAGAGAVWVVRDGGDVVRIDAQTGSVGPAHPLPGRELSLTAGPGGVWVGGVCLPEPTPATACSRQAAVALDPSTGAPDGRRALLPGGMAQDVRLVGSTLWLWGPRRGGDATVLARADAATGRVMAARALPGRPAIVPVSAVSAWSLDGGRVASAWSDRGRTLRAATGGATSLVMAAAGATAWTLERGAPVGGERVERLLALNARNGLARGRPIALGAAAVQGERLAVTAGVVWVLRPYEGALLRIPVGPRG